MFGTFRLALALMVVWYHLVDREMSGPVAVFGFYCLSGYLMTRIINGPYADGMSGYARYLTNRALRIYPLYLAVVAVTAAIVLIWPDAGSRFSPGLFDPQNLLRSIVIVGIDPLTATFVPAAWSLSVELIHYVAIGALLGRTRLATVLWIVFAIELVIFSTIRGGMPFSWFYFSPVPSTIAFATGAMIWQFRGWLPKSSSIVGAATASAVAVSGLFMSKEVGTSGGLYLGLALAAIAVTALRDLRENAVDRKLGDLAYPVFLLHMPVDKIVRGITDNDGLHMALISVPLAFALSWLAIALIERPLERIRAGLRGRTTAQGEQVGRPLPT